MLGWTHDHLLVVACSCIATCFFALAVRRWWRDRPRSSASPWVGVPDQSGAFAVAFAVLSPRSARLAGVAANACFPSAGPVARSGVEAGCVRWLDQYLARAQPRQRRLVLCLLWANELAPLVFGPSRARLSQLSDEERQRFLIASVCSRWYPRRVAAFALRGLMTMAYLADSAVLRQIGAVPNTDPFNLGDQAITAAAPQDDVPAPAVSGERLKVDLQAHLAELDKGDIG